MRLCVSARNNAAGQVTSTVDPEGKTTAEKKAIMREYRESQYEKLLDAVYLRRGWTKNGVPKISHLEKLGMDLPEVIEVVKPHQE